MQNKEEYKNIENMKIIWKYESILMWNLWLFLEAGFKIFLGNLDQSSLHAIVIFSCLTVSFCILICFSGHTLAKRPRLSLSY